MKKCKYCSHPGRACIPYLVTLSQSDTFDWCKIRKEALHLSNEDIAERTGVPKSTIDRIFSPRDTDCRFSTMQPVICVLSGCTHEELDCDNASSPSSEALLEQLKVKDDLIHHLDEEIKRQSEHIKQLQADAQANIDRAKQEEAESLAYMKKKEKGHVRAIWLLVSALALTLGLIIAALIVDRLNPEVGYFWLDRVASIIRGKIA